MGISSKANSGPAGLALLAWAEFVSTAAVGPIVPSKSFNIASINYAGGNAHNIVFSSALPSGNYVVRGIGSDAVNALVAYLSAQAAGSCTVKFRPYNGAITDPTAHAHIEIWG